LCVCADLLSFHRHAPSGSASRHSRCLHHHKPGTREPGGAATQESRRRSTAMLPWPRKSSAIYTATTIFSLLSAHIQKARKGQSPQGSALPTIVINGADITHRQLSADSGPLRHVTFSVRTGRYAGACRTGRGGSRGPSRLANVSCPISPSPD